MKSRIICIVPIYKAKKSDLNKIMNLPISVDELIIVDDYGDDYLEYIQNEKSRFEVKYICSNDIGLSRSINKGIELAIHDKADWIVILNQDSDVTEDFVGIFRKFIMRHS